MTCVRYVCRTQREYSFLNVLFAAELLPIVTTDLVGSGCDDLSEKLAWNFIAECDPRLAVGLFEIQIIVGQTVYRRETRQSMRSLPIHRHRREPVHGGFPATDPRQKVNVRVVHTATCRISGFAWAMFKSNYPSVSCFERCSN